MKSKIVYGPILSRRLGRSLGIDVIKTSASKKNCNYDCVYCQLGHVDRKISGPEAIEGAVSPEELVEALKNFHKDIEDLDYITFSGTCEPTLNLSLGEMSRQLRTVSKLPICVISNSSLTGRPEVRENLAEADLVVATFVSGNEKTFRKIHRPAAGVRLADVIEGLRELASLKRESGKGPKLALEIMLLDCSDEKKGPLNSTDEEVEALIEAVKIINPDEIEILTVSRPPAETWIVPVPEERLREIADRFAARFGEEKVTLVLKGLRRNRAGVKHKDPEADVYALLLRRPCTSEQVARGLDLDPEALEPILEKLLLDRKIVEISPDGRNDEKFFRAN